MQKGSVGFSSATGDALRAFLFYQRQPLHTKRASAPHTHQHREQTPCARPALRANTLRAPTRCGPTPCAQQQHLKGEESSLGVLSGEKTWQRPRKATRRKGGGTTRTRRPLTPRALPPPTRTGRPRTGRSSPSSPPRQTRLAATATPRWAARRRVRLQAAAPRTRHKHGAGSTRG